MVKKKNPPSAHTHQIDDSHRSLLNRTLIIFMFTILAGLVFLGSVSTALYLFEQNYQQKIYPGVRIDGVSFAEKTQEDVERYFEQKSLPYSLLSVTLSYEDKIATLSGKELAFSYDGKLSSTQAYSIGRSGNALSDLYLKWRAYISGIELKSIFKMNEPLLDESLTNLAASIDIPPQDALFSFNNGKVLAFKPSKSGKKLNSEQAKKMVFAYLTATEEKTIIQKNDVSFTLPVEIIQPKITTESSNNYGIKELLGVGTSRFHHSIAGRIHNIELAAKRIHGHLIAPGAIFSFNDALGDVSAATGFQPAYIIKEGRTVLGDGGGVCQVSTTMFRAAIKTGLSIVERHAHAYRVSYYEEESPVGIDATVFAPGYDLKFKNDTANYILIQAKLDVANYALAFEMYGTHDGRVVTMTTPVLTGQAPPPPELYQDDPTIPAGVVKQVDWSAWGGRTSFNYEVSRNNEIITKQTFASVYRPWQAVFLKGIKT